MSSPFGDSVHFRCELYSSDSNALHKWYITTLQFRDENKKHKMASYTMWEENYTTTDDKKADKSKK